ncbi:LysR family transcriptional regulator [Microbulbifer sp. S227A]|uniref:LysR family transcriptional regulator n=1 Tax=Microbulbifer sp. S227A TaxID=3415131 RepID=UPI003C7C85D9
MYKRRYNLPSISALTAFEAVARRQGVARAAEELHTSQPAISRHIRNLEMRHDVALFTRQGQGNVLTAAGHAFYAEVVVALDKLQEATSALSHRSREVTVACSHAVAHLLLMPHYGRLRRSLAKRAELRMLTTEYGLIHAAIDTGADIVFEYSDTPPERDHVVVLEEEVKPVGTPGVIAQAVAALDGTGPPPGLLALQRENFGWLGWPDWFVPHPEFSDWPTRERHDNYVYLLEAAVAGNGLALGWKGFVNTYLERGLLRELSVPWYSRNTRIYASLTRHGKHSSAAHTCLKLLENLGEAQTCHGEPISPADDGLTGPSAGR